MTLVEVLIAALALLVQSWRVALYRRLAEVRCIKAEIAEEQLAVFYKPAADAVKQRRARQ